MIPKSENYQHLKQNVEAMKFKLDEEEINIISTLEKNLHLCWNPENVT